VYLEFIEKEDVFIIKAKGEWTKFTASEIIKYTLPKTKKRIIFDVKDITTFDTAGVLAFIKIYEKLQSFTKVEVVNYTLKQKELYDLLKNHIHYRIPKQKSSFLEEIGKASIDFLKEIKFFLAFLGELFVNFLALIFHPIKNFRYKEVSYHIYQSGVKALLIVGITSFLVGIVIAYQTGVQLSKFGASIFIVDTVGISITRELGPMITAIVIAGRSASAYTAEIGAMKITQEIDALKTFAFNPFIFLVIPRIIALTIALPLLIFFADIVGIIGGAIASKMQLGISYDLFLNRIYETLDVKHYILGLIKAPFFAFFIATIGAFRGFEVQSNTQSLGVKTTQAVVNAIFLVIAIDALFSIIYTELGL